MAFRRKTWPLSALIVSLALLVSCASPQDSPPVPAVEASTVAKEAEPEERPNPVTHVRTEMGNGFRLGPYPVIARIRWQGVDEIEAVLGTELGRVPLSGGLPTTLPLSESDRRDLLDPDRNLESPDRTRVVVYGKVGPGRFIDRRTGEEHTLNAPGFYGSSVFDSWSPDGSHFLVQSVRTDPVPGFYFMDGAGKLSFQFHEPGYYAHRARWAPDGKRVAFLAVPLNTKYPTAPDGWEEQPFGPRVGLLTLASGTAHYVDLGPGQVAYAYPVWSPDAAKLAVTCGDLLIEDHSSQGWSGQTTTVRNSQVCVIDPRTGALSRVGNSLTPDMIITPVAFSPDGQSLLVQVWKDRTPGTGYGLLSLDGGDLVPLGGKPVWIDDSRLLVVSDQSVTLVDRRGELLRTLISGYGIGEVSMSPDSSYVAVVQNTSPASADRSDYLSVVRLGD